MRFTPHLHTREHLLLCTFCGRSVGAGFDEGVLGIVCLLNEAFGRLDGNQFDGLSCMGWELGRGVQQQALLAEMRLA